MHTKVLTKDTTSPQSMTHNSSRHQLFDTTTPLHQHSTSRFMSSSCSPTNAQIMMNYHAEDELTLSPIVKGGLSSVLYFVSGRSDQRSMSSRESGSVQQFARTRRVCVTWSKTLGNQGQNAKFLSRESRKHQGTRCNKYVL